jgi:hypothetical protein
VRARIVVGRSCGSGVPGAAAGAPDRRSEHRTRRFRGMAGAALGRGRSRAYTLHFLCLLCLELAM